MYYLCVSAGVKRLTHRHPPLPGHRRWSVTCTLTRRLMSRTRLSKEEEPVGRSSACTRRRTISAMAFSQCRLPRRLRMMIGSKPSDWHACSNSCARRELSACTVSPVPRRVASPAITRAAGSVFEGRVERPLTTADSTGRRNSLMKSLSWCFVVQCLSGSFVEAPSDRVELGLRIP